MQNEVGNDVDVFELFPIEAEVQVGYAEKRSQLWVHHTSAFERGEIRWLKHASVCRHVADRDPYGEPRPWRM